MSPETTMVEREQPSELPSELIALLERFVSPISARAMVRSALVKAERATGTASHEAILQQLELSTNILIPPSQRDEVLSVLRAAVQKLGRKPEPQPEPQPDDEETVALVRTESDLNYARMLAREASHLVGLRGYTAQKIVTAVSELARNIARYVGDGKLRFRIDPERKRIIIIAQDRGPGIANLDEILAGNYRSRTGLGRGLIGVRNLADEFDIETGPTGTKVTIVFRYP